MESGTSGGGPAPFLLKTYEMVDDKATDEIVSWSSTNKSFVVWNPPEFSRILLPSYFKHSNFSSFIRQLNTYGFRKIDSERWEFANDEFIRDEKHLLKNIHRRKPTHSHSNPQANAMDPERSAYEEKIEGLSHERANLEAELLKMESQRAAAANLLEGLSNRFNNIERRQESLLTFIELAIQNPEFVKKLSSKVESMDISAYKKRRIPEADEFRHAVDSSYKPEFTSVIPEFSDKLNLEPFSPVSDVNLPTPSTQSSNDNDELRRTSCLFDSEPLELSDTGASCAPTFETKDPEVNFVEGPDSCLLSLTLGNDHAQEVSETHNEAKNIIEEKETQPVRVNDKFWEQFLTERPGHSDNEEASSTFSLSEPIVSFLLQRCSSFISKQRSFFFFFSATTQEVPV